MIEGQLSLHNQSNAFQAADGHQLVFYKNPLSKYPPTVRVPFADC
jgi:hypothetical protein